MTDAPWLKLALSIDVNIAYDKKYISIYQAEHKSINQHRYIQEYF